MKYLLNYFLFSFIGAIFVFISCRKKLSCEGCGEDNKPPTAIAAPDQVITLPTDSVSLDGRNSSDPDGTISEWLWTKISGPASFNVIRQSDSTTKVKALVVGTYQFELKVTDNGGLSAKDTVQVTVDTVQSAKHPPVANAGSDTAIILPANTIDLDGNGSTDPDNNITAYSWTKIAGPSSFTIANSNTVQTQVINLVEGAYQFELKVADANGLLSKDTVVIFVNTVTETQSGIWEIIIRLPIDSAFIDDYYRDTEGWCISYISGPGSYIIEGGWVKNLVPGVYFFTRNGIECIRGSETIKVTVLDDPNERNTITYQNLLWEYNYAWNYDDWLPHLFLSRPAWPASINHPMEVSLQMDFLNSKEWFKVPSALAGYDFRLDCRFYLNGCFTFFIIKPLPENRSWDGKKANLKIKVL